jgi:hypothetical protein
MFAWLVAYAIATSTQSRTPEPWEVLRMDQSEIRSRQVKQRYPERRRSLRQQLLGEYVTALMRVGETPEARLSWLLDFLQRDVKSLSTGDLLNLAFEIRVYGSPLRTGYYIFDLGKGNTLEQMRRSLALPMRELERGRSELMRMLTDIHRGDEIGMNDLRGLGIRGAKVPKTSQLKLAWLGDPIVVMKMRLLLDFEQVDLRRLRQCERGSEPTDRALGITPCRRWYYAHDLRQRFCSPQCGKEVRWKRWWQASGKQINEERRKGRLTNG